MRTLTRGLLLCALAAALPAGAASVTIYRCVDASGGVTLQNGRRCAKGLHEQSRVVETPATAHARPASKAATARPVRTVEPPLMAMPAPSTPQAVTPTTAAPTTSPPAAAPPLFACGTEPDRYFSESANTDQCAPLRAVGLDGREMGTVQACEVQTAHCELVPEADLCAAWATRRHAAESALQFSPEQFDAARAELDRVNAATTGTVCGR